MIIEGKKSGNTQIIIIVSVDHESMYEISLNRFLMYDLKTKKKLYYKIEGGERVYEPLRASNFLGADLSFSSSG